MDESFICQGIEIENVSQFKYLGLLIDKEKNHPGSMLK